MRRRRPPIDIWPALADLMTVLAVVGLVLAVGATVLAENDRRRAEEAISEARELREKLRKEREEAVENRSMFEAIQRVQRVIEVLSQDRMLKFGPDQSLEFDNLVSFEVNNTNPDLDPLNKERLGRFCRRLSEEMGHLRSEGSRFEDLFLIHVEGHTDSRACELDPLCNWDFSARRATSFAKLMRDPAICPGGTGLALVPIAYADTRPSLDSGVEPRRVSLRLVPDYQRLIRRVGSEEG